MVWWKFSSKIWKHFFLKVLLVQLTFVFFTTALWFVHPCLSVISGNVFIAYECIPSDLWDLVAFGGSRCFVTMENVNTLSFES